MRKPIRGVASLLLLLAVTAGGWFAWIQLGDPWYLSEAIMMCSFYELPPESTRSFAVPPGRYVERLDQAIDGELRRQISAETLQGVVDWPRVRNTGWMQSHGGDADAAAVDLRRRLVAHRVPDSTIYRLKLALPGTHDAQTVLNALVTVHLNQRAVDRASRLHDWFETYLLAEAQVDDLLMQLKRVAEAPDVSLADLDQDEDLRLSEIMKELNAAWYRQREARESLAAAGARFPSRTEIAWVSRAVPPTEARRVWWRWPWD